MSVDGIDTDLIALTGNRITYLNQMRRDMCLWAHIDAIHAIDNEIARQEAYRAELETRGTNE